MEIFNADRQKNVEMNNLLQRIKYEVDKQESDDPILFPFLIMNGHDIEFEMSPSEQILFKELKEMGVIELKERNCEEINKTLGEATKLKNKTLIIESYLIKPIEPKFSQFCVEYEEKIEQKLREKIVFQKAKDKKIELPHFPKNIKWHDISIQFLNNEEVVLHIKNKLLQTTYEAMGFQDEKNKTPNKQWELLLLLSIKGNGLSWRNNYDLTLQKINSVKKQKQLLSEKLKMYFQINEDPFYLYTKEDGYRIKIRLIPVAEQEIEMLS